MRKVPLQVLALAAIPACVLTACSGNFRSSGSGSGSSDPSTSPSNDLPGYAPGWLRSGCTDTGASWRNPLHLAGYSGSLACVHRANTDAVVGYYQYASPARTAAARTAAASASGVAGAAARSAGCPAGPGEPGRWSAGGAAAGDLTCAGRPGGGALLIWDDQRTGVVAVASSPVLIPGALYAFWTANGASSDRSAHQATST